MVYKLTAFSMRPEDDPKQAVNYLETFTHITADSWEGAAHAGIDWLSEHIPDRPLVEIRMNCVESDAVQV